MASTGLTLEHTVIVQASPERVLSAFFNAEDLAAWWHVVRSVTVPRPLGTFSLEWPVSAERDEVLGPLGGTLQGLVMDYQGGSEFFVADVYWQPPEGEPVGPMALEVRCRPQGSTQMTRLTVRQTGDDDGLRWRRFFEVASAGWQRALSDLKAYLDKETTAP
jgi:uncharacterized protein YndB with AHSA1/START domain